MKQFYKNILVLLAFGGATCNREAADSFLWSKKPLSSGQMVWADQTNRVYFSGDRSEFTDKQLVMVRIAPGQFDPEYWQKKTNTIAIKPPYRLEYGYALVDVQSAAEQLELATLAHNSGGCGNIDPINLNLTLAEGTTEIIPTVYHEAVKLTQVADLIDEVDSARISDTIAQLEAKGTRFHKESTGLETPDDIVAMWTAAGAGLANFTVAKSNYSTSDQSNVVATLTGTTDPDTVVIIGAHMDSINGTINNPDQNDAPGADDDASGIATITEVIRVFAAAGATFDRTIEFHAYGAEEVGRYGSIALANAYRAEDRTVAGMFQIDMNAYSDDPSQDTIYFVSNFTDEYLRRVLKTLMQTYLGGRYEEMPLTAGTSDHKSWYQVGYAAVFPFEHPVNFNKALHSPNDTLATINHLAKAARFGQLALTYLSHHAGLASAADAYQSGLQANAPETADSADLPLAIIDGPSANEYYMAVGTDPTVIRVEACEITSADSVTCSADRRTYTALEAKSGRTIHLNETAVGLANGDRYRLYGYDEDDVLVAVRNVSLSKK